MSNFKGAMAPGSEVTFFWQAPPFLLWVSQSNQRKFQFLWLLCSMTRCQFMWLLCSTRTFHANVVVSDGFIGEMGSGGSPLFDSGVGQKIRWSKVKNLYNFFYLFFTNLMMENDKKYIITSTWVRGYVFDSTAVFWQMGVYHTNLLVA